MHEEKGRRWVNDVCRAREAVGADLLQQEPRGPFDRVPREGAGSHGLPVDEGGDRGHARVTTRAAKGLHLDVAIPRRRLRHQQLVFVYRGSQLHAWHDGVVTHGVPPTPVWRHFDAVKVQDQYLVKKQREHLGHWRCSRLQHAQLPRDGRGNPRVAHRAGRRRVIAAWYGAVQVELRAGEVAANQRGRHAARRLLAGAARLRNDVHVAPRDLCAVTPRPQQRLRRGPDAQGCVAGIGAAGPAARRRRRPREVVARPADSGGGAGCHSLARHVKVQLHPVWLAIDGPRTDGHVRRGPRQHVKAGVGHGRRREPHVQPDTPRREKEARGGGPHGCVDLGGALRRGGHAAPPVRDAVHADEPRQRHDGAAPVRRPPSVQNAAARPDRRKRALDDQGDGGRAEFGRAQQRARGAPQ